MQKDIFVLEYNFGQRQFHIHTFAAAVKENSSLYKAFCAGKEKNIRTDKCLVWIPIFFGTDEEVSEALHKFDKLRAVSKI